MAIEAQAVGLAETCQQVHASSKGELLTGDGADERLEDGRYDR